MKLGTRVYWAERIDMGKEQPPQVRVRSGTLIFRQDDAACVIEGTAANPHPDTGVARIIRGGWLMGDRADADMYANGMANRLISNFKFPSVDVFYSDGQSQRLRKA